MLRGTDTDVEEDTGKDINMHMRDTCALQSCIYTRSDIRIKCSSKHKLSSRFTPARAADVAGPSNSIVEIELDEG